MASVVKKTTLPRGDDRNLNDLQKAVADIADSINKSVLKFAHLSRFSVQVSSKGEWVALGNTLTRQAIYRAREPGTLLAAGITIASTIPFSTVDFRQFYIERVRKGVYSTVMAARDTKVEGIVSNKPFDLELAPGPRDLEILEDDVLALTIGGGGTLPAVGIGIFELYLEKEED